MPGTKHTLARAAKQRAKTMFADDPAIAGIGIGRTEDGAGYAVMIFLADASALPRIPTKLGSVPVRTTFTETAKAI